MDCSPLGGETPWTDSQGEIEKQLLVNLQNLLVLAFHSYFLMDKIDLFQEGSCIVLKYKQNKPQSSPYTLSLVLPRLHIRPDAATTRSACVVTRTQVHFLAIHITFMLQFTEKTKLTQSNPQTDSSRSNTRASMDKIQNTEMIITVHPINMYNYSTERFVHKARYYCCL